MRGLPNAVSRATKRPVARRFNAKPTVFSTGCLAYRAADDRAVGSAQRAARRTAHCAPDLYAIRTAIRTTSRSTIRTIQRSAIGVSNQPADHGVFSAANRSSPRGRGRVSARPTAFSAARSAICIATCSTYRSASPTPYCRSSGRGQ